MKEIPLTQGKIALVEDEDFDRVNQFKWRAWHHRNTWYAVADLPRVNGKSKRLYLHSFVLPGSPEVDHRNRDGLNCQRSNLRPATHAQNRANQGKRKNCSSIFKGVGWRKDLGCWRAYIGKGYRYQHLGHFALEENAARAYDAAAKVSFGEFACLNFP